ncbi:MAG: cytochrome b/b6 domain-containing protein [Burkholderiaceae bacterium]
MAPSQPVDTTRVWSLVQRLLHWTLAASVIAAFATHEGGGNWHEWTGYTALACAALRLVLGFARWPWAGKYARFATFVKSPATTLAYARSLFSGSEPRTLGHNPLGAWMVVTLLLTTLVASLSGWLYTTDRFWGIEWVERLHSFFGHAFIPLVALHLGGVAFTSWRHQDNLVKAMLTGDKRIDHT